MNKKEWLDKLYYDFGKQQFDFKVCGLNKLPDGEVRSTKWRSYSEVCSSLNSWEYYKIGWINNREILPNEIVIDIEEKEEKKLIEICNVLEKKGIVFSVFDTGSRGYHIHIFGMEKLGEEDKRRFVGLGGDMTKIHQGSMIALENTPHWKSGKMKREIEWKKK